MTDPIHTELTVLPADEDGKAAKIGWTVREYLGVEVLSAPPGLSYDEVRSTANWPEGFKPQPITVEDAISEGAHVIIPNLFGGLSVYRIGKMEDGSFCGRSGDMIAFLEWSPDDRNCWVCGGTGNLAAIMKLDLEK